MPDVTIYLQDGSVTTLLVLQQRISEAETAYHKLMTGVQPRVFVDQNGERVEFVAAKAPDLYRYIGELKKSLPVGAAGRVANHTKPIGYLF